MSPLKILYLHQYFRLPSESGGNRSYWFAKKLIDSGYEVTMITSRNKQDKFIKREIIEGINVIYIRNYYDNTLSKIKRIRSFLNFTILSSYFAIKEKKVSLCYATSTPLSIGIPALLLRKFRNVKYVFEVRDLWPEGPIQLGIIKSKLFIHSAKWLEKTIYKYSEHIITLSPGMSDGVLSTGTSSKKVTMIPNMAKTEIFFPHEKNNKILKENGIFIDPEIFNIIYFGSFGLANGVLRLLDIANEIKHSKDISFVLIGDGRDYVDIQNKIEKHSLSNVKLYRSRPMLLISEIINNCSCSIICFEDIPILSTNSPNKLFDSLAAGLPIIVTNDGWTKELAINYNCGEYVNLNNKSEFIKLIFRWKDSTDLLTIMGKNSRRIAIDLFDKNLLCNKFIDVLKRFVPNN